jgi:hypothetical protein
MTFEIAICLTVILGLGLACYRMVRGAYLASHPDNILRNLDRSRASNPDWPSSD